MNKTKGRKRTDRPYLSLLLLAAAVIAGSASPADAEEGTVTAFSAWLGEGRFFRVGEEQALFIGAFGGILFVEDGQGALDAARILCPGTLDINLATGAQAGEGRCIITNRAGNRVFAEWNCSGIHAAGCQGTFTLTGGTGRLQGITGESEFLVSVPETAAGVAVWPALRYKFP